MSDTPQLLALMQKTREMKAYDCVKEFESLARKLEKENAALRADNERLANAAKEVLASYILTMGVELGHPCPENLVECRELRAAIDATRKEAQP